MANLILTTNLQLKSNSAADFTDTTGNTGSDAYNKNGNIDYSSVKAVRIQLGNYTTLQAQSPPPSGIFVQYTEYIKVSGHPEIINGKTFSVSDIFVPQFANIATTFPEQWQTTGYYIPPILNTWLPTACGVPLELDLSQFGQVGNNIEDNIYLYGYEVYYNEHTGNFSAIANASYMVLNGTGIYQGNTYYAGEIFTANDTSTITVSNSLVQLYATISAYATLVYLIESGINDLIEQQIGKNNQDLVQQTENYILKIRCKYEALLYSCKTNNVSLLYSYQTIQYLNARILQLLNPLNT